MSPEPTSDLTEQEAEVAKRYFGSFVDDYHQAFEGRGRQPLHALINRLFRRKTFQRRTDVVRDWLAAHGVEGKQVLDLGCGSGEVSRVAAQLGARVTGLDIVPGMIAVATEQAAAAGLADRTTFRVHNLVHDAIEPADVVMMIGVIEYYRDIDRLLPRVAGAVREMLVIVDTRGPWWRRTLRRVLARMKNFHLYYHSPDRVSRIVAGAGLRETRRVAGHSYTAMTFER